MANGVLALITLLAIGVAGAVTFRGFGTANVVQSSGGASGSDGYRAVAAAFLH